MFKQITKPASGSKSFLAAIVLGASLMVAPLPAIAASDLVIGDAANGETLFKRCAACHKVGADAKNGVGPQLNAIIGRIAGSAEGYRYGKDMVAAGEAGLIWDAQNLVQYLLNPKAFLRAFLDDSGARAKMSFRVRNEEDATDLVAYLVSLQEE